MLIKTQTKTVNEFLSVTGNYYYSKNGKYSLQVQLGISDTLEAEASLAVLKQAIKDYSKPEIINSDQGSQFTCEDWISYLESEGIEISMDSKGKAIDNIFIERFWRSVKYDYVYLHPAGNGLELYQGLKEYMHYYNYELHHQGIDRKTLAERYQAA